MLSVPCERAVRRDGPAEEVSGAVGVDLGVDMGRDDVADVRLEPELFGLAGALVHQAGVGKRDQRVFVAVGQADGAGRDAGDGVFDREIFDPFAGHTFRDPNHGSPEGKRGQTGVGGETLVDGCLERYGAASLKTA